MAFFIYIHRARGPSMEKAEALRSIANDLLEYIHKKVKVNFDNARQIPLSFDFSGRRHRIEKVLGRFKILESSPALAFLVSSDCHEIYFLYFHPCVPDQIGHFHKGSWVLCFRVLTDRELMAFYREDRKMLVHMTFKKIVDFHGHLCPDLVLGGKASQYIQKVFASNREPDGGISIIAENSTSALDAIQVMLGATVGNQRLQVLDYGKHNYTFIGKNGRTGIRLSLRPQFFGDEEKYDMLEQKIINNQAILDDVVQFQKLLDSRVKRLFSLSPENLFNMESIEVHRKPTESASVYLTCRTCGEQVLKSRVIEHRGKMYCTPCFQHINTGRLHRGLQ